MRLAAALLASTFAAASVGQIQLLPAGEFAARDGRPETAGTYKLTDQRGRELAAELTATAAKTPVVVDYDHRSIYVAEHGGKAEAAGWITRADWRDGVGLFATVEWTQAAAQHIKSGEYRYVSPVFFHDRDTGEVKQVVMAALVNHPALLGMEPALAALSAIVPRQENSMTTLLVALAAALGVQNFANDEAAITAVKALKTKADAPAKAVLPAALFAALGLAAGAEETAVLSAVTALKSKPAVPAALATELGLAAGADEAAALAAVKTLKTPATEQLAVIAQLQGQLAVLSAHVNGDRVSRIVDDAIAAHKLPPALRDQYLALGKKDEASLVAILAATPVIPGLAGQSGGQERGGDGLTALSATQSLIAAQLGIDPAAYAKELAAKAA